MISEEELIEIVKRANYAQKGPWKAYIEVRDHESGSDFIMKVKNVLNAIKSF
jgi:hypothetical protein